MISRNPVLLIALLLSATASAESIEIMVGDRPIEIVVPDGYTELTPAMLPYYETMKAYVAPSNNRYLNLLRIEKANALLDGEFVDMLRHMTIDSEKNLSESSVSSEMFAEIRNIVLTQLDKTFAEANEQVPGLLEQGTNTVNESFGTDIEMEVGQMVPLPAHLDLPYAVANSMYMKMAVSTEDEAFEEQVVVATMLLLHVKDKVLFLYVYGEESDLEWTRETATDWAEKIISTNPLTPEIEEILTQPQSGGINWTRVLRSAFIGGVIGGVIGLIGWINRRRKKKAPEDAKVHRKSETH